MELIHKTDEEILNLLNPIMDNMMEGSTEINHAKHTCDFTDRMKAIVTPERLEQMCKDYQSRWGLFGKREFVAIFRRKESIAVVWKQFCSNTTDEHVAEAVFVENGNTILIDHAMVY
ncbi:MAG: hypothetical protein ABL919_14670 [Methylococcales bacterium]|nr:hypothetical protein [Methylococcaceae bacterium]